MNLYHKKTMPISQSQLEKTYSSTIDNKYLLIADDHMIMREGYYMILRDQFPDYKVVMVENGKDALTLIKRQTPNLLLLDVVMPNFSGLEVLSILSKQKALFPIICISCYANNDNGIEVLNRFMELLNLEYYNKEKLTKKILLASVERLLSISCSSV